MSGNQGQAQDPPVNPPPDPPVNPPQPGNTGGDTAQTSQGDPTQGQQSTQFKAVIDEVLEQWMSPRCMFTEADGTTRRAITMVDLDAIELVDHVLIRTESTKGVETMR